MDVADGILPEKVPSNVTRMTMEEQEILEEERRLFYVGITRAKNHLYVFTTGAESLLADELFGRKLYPSEDKVRVKSVHRKAYGGFDIDSFSLGRPDELPRSWDRKGFERFVDGLGEGLAVTHLRFGEGVVTKVGDKKVRILFEDKERTLSLRVLYEKRLLTLE